MDSLLIAQIGMSVIAATFLGLCLRALLGLERPEEKTPWPVALALIPVALFLLLLVFYIFPHLIFPLKNERSLMPVLEKNFPQKYDPE